MWNKINLHQLLLTYRGRMLTPTQQERIVSGRDDPFSIRVGLEVFKVADGREVVIRETSQKKKVKLGTVNDNVNLSTTWQTARRVENDRAGGTVGTVFRETYAIVRLTIGVIGS